MAGSSVNKTGTGFGGDVITSFKNRRISVVQWVSVSRSQQIGSGHSFQDLEGFSFGQVDLVRNRFDQIRRHHQFSGAGVGDDGIGKLGVDRNSQIGGHSPRRSRPDGYLDGFLGRMKFLEGVRGFDDFETDVNRFGNVVFGVLQLGFGERRSRRWRPVNRLPSTEDKPLLEHFPEDTDLCRLEFWLKREVRFFEISENTVSLETLRLFVDRLLCEFGCLFAESDGSELLSFFGFHRLQDFQFDRQTVAIPTRNVVDLLSVQGLLPVDEIFQHLVERVPTVQTPVRVRGPIVQDESILRCLGRRFR
mmetsp:Transcript_33421/g.69909  ORF Transcript_33421/g.69909 Transcript_33421/m.69909 type:complete len:305 (+) Transcript_33421:2123-3037(+)